MMMFNVDIDTEKLATEIEKVKKAKGYLKDVLDKIKEENDELKDYWSSKTATSVFEGFEDFYKEYKNDILLLENDIAFLEEVVNKSYQIEDENINKAIDDNIAI